MKNNFSVLFILFFFCGYSNVSGATFVVGSNWQTSDINPGDGICQTPFDPPENCSLVAAIEEANAHPGSDTITFSAPLEFTLLPVITDSVTIDGSSQWDSANRGPGITISAGLGDVGLHISTSNTVVTGILFDGAGTGIRCWGVGNRIGGPGTHEGNVFFNGTAGLFIEGAVIDGAASTTVQYNNFGTRNGEIFGQPGSGLYVGDVGIDVSGKSSRKTIIEHNLIGNMRTGIYLRNGSDSKVRSNTIGKPTKDTPYKIPNEIGIGLSASSAEITNNTIADNYLAQISNKDGVYSGSLTISGNYIGSNFSVHGAVVMPADGVHLMGASHALISDNFVYYNTGDGIVIDIGTATIENNYIYNNLKNGVRIQSFSAGTTVSGNEIYNNGENGILLRYARQSVIKGNMIGSRDGFTDEGNTLSGILIQDKSTNNLIGGLAPADANYILFNKGSGIYITDAGTTDNDIAGNVIGSTELSYYYGYRRAGNAHHGVALYNQAESNNIGLVGDIIAPNLILDSGYRGIAVINSNHNRIFGNMIGTDGGARNWGNTYSGIHIIGNNNTVKYNTVAYNGFGPALPQAGIVIEEGVLPGDTFNNQISENSIFGNAAAGIDIVNGANLNIPPPLLQRTGKTLYGTTLPNCVVEFFSGSDRDEGRFFEGSVVADGSGSYSWQKTGSFHGAHVTATTTTPVNPNTSEFSLPVRGAFPWQMFQPAIRKK